MKQCPICGVRFEERVVRCPIDAAELISLPDPLIGQTVQERYVIESRLGSGGMATVYRGRHQVIDRQVALKFLKPKHAKEPTARARFLREARAVNRVQHEHIVDVSDFGETSDGLVYMVMEYLEGHTLTAEISRGPLSIDRVCHIGLQLAQALASAHEHGIVHRDVKPANSFLIQRGEDDDFVKLLDFGLARGTEDVALTSSNLLFGTPEYMAPEQVRGGSVGAKADLYALGCVLFEMVVGRIPFDDGPAGVIYRHLYDLPPRPSQLRPEMPQELERLILRLLSKTPEQRPANAIEVATELTHIASALPGASRPRRASGVAPNPQGHQGHEGHQNKHDDAELNLNALHARFAERYSNVTPPPQVADAVRRVSVLAIESDELKQELANLEAETDEAAGRATQRRISSAIESLEMDAACATQAIEAMACKRQRAAEQLRAQTTQLLAAWRTHEARDSAQADTRLRNRAILMEQLRAWALAQCASDELEDQVRAHQALRSDLEAQITELKRRLLDLDAALSPSVAKAAELQLQLSAKLATIRAEAGRITEQLARKPHSA